MGSIFARLLLRAPSPPGHDLALRQVELDGQEVTVMARGDAIEVFYGRKDISSFSMSPRVAIRLAWFILWRWFVNETLFGLRSRAWFWAARKERARDQAQTDHQ